MQWSDVTFLTSIFRAEQFPEIKKPLFAFVGRSNVGKSTLLNTICSRKNMARVSARPGKTRSLNLFLVADKCYFVDLPGYGYASGHGKEKFQWQELVEKCVLRHPYLKDVFILMDMRHSLQNNDLLMVEFLNHQHLPYTVILTKADKLSQQKQHKQLRHFCDTLSLSADQCIPFSGIKKNGVEAVRSRILQNIS